MRQGRLHPIAIAAIALSWLAFAAPASATDYCVNAPACVAAGGTDSPSIDSAVTASDMAAGADTLTIGPSDTPYPASGQIHGSSGGLTIRGAGIGRTVVKASGAGGTFNLSGTTKSVSDVTLDGTGASRALRLDLGAAAERVAVVGTPTVGVLVQVRATLRDATIDVPGTAITRTNATTSPMVLTRVRISTPGTAFFSPGGDADFDHVRIDARVGINQDDTGTLNLSDTAINLTGCTSAAPCTGARLIRTTFSATRVTIAGPANATGVSADVRPSDTTTPAATLRDSIVATGGTDVVQARTATITARNSAFRTFSGAVTIADSYFSSDPKLADPAAGDLRLRGDSPLLDRAAPTTGGLDAAGLPRELDGDGDGLVRPDLGAYERQYFTAAAAGPASGVAGQAVGFTGDAPGTVPNDPLTWSWAFDDGGTASGREVSHVFADAGVHTATVTVTDGAGVKRTATVTVPVEPAPTAPSAGDGSGGVPAGPPVTPAAPADLTVPRIGLSLPRQRLSKLSKKGLAVKLDASEPCAASLSVGIDAKTAKALGLGRRSVTIGKLQTRLTAGRKTVRVKLSSRLRKALAGSKKAVKLTMKGTARDDAGNAGPLSGRATLPR